MENVITDKRGLVIILVIVTVVIFIGAVWAIATYLPLNLSGLPRPSSSATVPVAGRNCTYPISYWKNHPELYPAQLIIGGQVYKAKDIKGIFSDDTQELTAQLQAQLTGAYLNFISGADQSYVETTIFEAYGWLVQHPVGSVLTDSEREAGTRLDNVLETYNRGLTEVAPCEPGSAITGTESSSATETPNILLTITPNETITPTPSETPSPTYFPTEPIVTVSAPSRTPIPTTSVPQQPSSTPSQTLSPSATNTPTNTIAPPTATITPAITPPTWTPPPLPTDTWTPPPIPTP